MIFSLFILSLFKSSGADEGNDMQQVYEATPPPPDYGYKCATQLLVNQSFANSYGHPVSIDYNPPVQCSNFTHVTAELHITVFDHQYDRLVHLIKDGIEVWRPSTPEPVGFKVYSKLNKDLSTFTNLFKTKGNIVFSLDNIISELNDGVYHVELNLSFYNSLKSNNVTEGNWFYNSDIPPTNFYPLIANEVQVYKSPAEAIIPVLDRNTTRAVLNVYASGNYDEEFWYAGDSDSNGATRLIEVFINDQIAGAVDPFPIVYTGGISPGLWHPLMGLKSSDVPSYIVDITPFLPHLWESPSKLTVAIGNGYSSQAQAILSNWIIDVSLLTWQENGVYGTGEYFNTSVTSLGHPTNQTKNGILTTETGYYKRILNSANLTFERHNRTTNGLFECKQMAAMVNLGNSTSRFEEVSQIGQGKTEISFNDEQYSKIHRYPLQLQQQIGANDSVELVSVMRAYDVNMTTPQGHLSELILQNSYYKDNQYVSETRIKFNEYERKVGSTNNRIIFDIY